MQTFIKKVSAVTVTVSMMAGSMVPALLLISIPSLASAITTSAFAPTTNSANGAESWDNPANAYSDGSGFASNPANDEKHIYGGFGISLPSNIVVDGIQVFADAWSEDNDCRVDVEVSRDGGTNWSSEKNGSLGTTESTITYGGTTDDWFSGSNNWTSTQLANLAVRVQAEDPSGGCSAGDDVFLDFLRVVIHYTETEPTSGSYVISGTATTTEYTVNILGSASSTPYVGQLNDQHISIDWDDDGDGIFNNYITEDSDNAGNDAGLTSEITFDIDSFGGSGNSKFFVDNNWTASHTYATSGPKTIIVKVHHANPTGAEGSDLATIEFDIVITPPEDTLLACSDLADNDNDGLVDLADPDCADFIPTLTVTKIVTNNNGGTAVVGDFPLFIDGFSVSSGIASTTSVGLHTVSETTNADYIATIGGDCASDGTITLVIGDDAECTITNDDVPPSLTLLKEVINSFGGSALATAWNLIAQGATSTISGPTGISSGPSFQAGTYTLSESGGPTNYDLSVICDINGATSSVSMISLLIGDVASCTFTNTEQEPGTLTVIKQVLNNNPSGFEGTAESDDFTITVSNGTPGVFVGSETGVEVTIPAGAAFTVTETGGPAGYGVSYSGDCSGSMPVGGNLTCTVINDDNSPTQAFLTIVKNVVNDNGGLALGAEWDLYASSTMLSTGVATLLDPGTYDISESGGPDGYEQVSVMCSANGGAAAAMTSIELVAGSSYVCTITNDDIAPSLTLIKDVVNDNGGTASNTDWTLYAVGSLSSIQGEGGASSDDDFQAGTYTLSESGGPGGYTPSSWSCIGVSNVDDEITLDIGESAICTITNDDQQGTLVVVKELINDNGGTMAEDDFSFQIDGGTPIAFESDGQNEILLDAGTYDVTEVLVSGYGVEYENCSDVVITNGGTATCTITNDDGMATLEIVKQTVGADGTFTITVSGDDDYEMVTSGGWATTTVALDAGTYEISEGAVAGWTLTDSFCSNADAIDNVTLDVGDTVTCTLVNTATGSDLSVIKTVDDTTPDVGQTITFTLIASNAGPASADDVVVTDVLPSGLTYVSHSGGTYATSTGEWSIGTLPAASSTILQIVVTVDSGTQGTQITNTASVEENDVDVSDYDSGNDSEDVTVTVNTPSAPPPSGGGGGGNGPVSGSFGSVLGASTGPTTGQVLGESCGLYLNKHLRLGSAKNDREQTIKLQNFLNKWMNANLPVTGFFGPLTEASVRAFQAQYADEILAPWGISTPTGLVYLSTIRKVNMLECSALQLTLPTLVPWSQNPNAQ